MSRARQEEAIEVKSPFPPQALFDLYDWSVPVWNAVADDNTPKDRESFIELHERLIQQPGIRTWGVWRGSDLGGYIRAEINAARPWLAVWHCLFKKSFYGSRNTVPALHHVARELFAVGVLKIEGWVFDDNYAVIALSKRVGAIDEGRLTAQAKRGGKYVDMRVLGLYKEDVERKIRG